MASATKAPPGATMTPVPVALARSGRKAVNVGVTTLKTTVPRGVFSTVRSFWVHFSDPGATPGQTFTICGPAEAEHGIRNTRAIAVDTARSAQRITTFPHEASRPWPDLIPATPGRIRGDGRSPPPPAPRRS